MVSKHCEMDKACVYTDIESVKDLIIKYCLMLNEQLQRDCPAAQQSYYHLLFQYRIVQNDNVPTSMHARISYCLCSSAEPRGTALERR